MEFIKKNLLVLAKDHKEHYNSSNCIISLYTVRLVFKELNIPLTEEELVILF